MTYTYPPNADHVGCCTDPTCRTEEEWIALIAADLDSTGHHDPAAQVRAITVTDTQDYLNAADHIDAIAGAVNDIDLFDRLCLHVWMLRRLTGDYTARPVAAVLTARLGRREPNTDRAGHELPCSCAAGYDVREEDL